MAKFINNATPLKEWLEGINEKVLNVTATSFNHAAYVAGTGSDKGLVKIANISFEKFTTPTGTTSGTTTSSIDIYTEQVVRQNLVTASAEYPVALGISGASADTSDELNFATSVTFNPTTKTFTNASISGTAAYAIGDGTGANIISTYATKKEVSELLSGANAMQYKGVVDDTHALPTVYDKGWVYKVAKAGTYAGQVCEVGDMLISNTQVTATSGTDQNSNWDGIQLNIDGYVLSPGTSADNQIALYSGTTGKSIKAAGTYGSQNTAVFVDGGVITACTGILANGISGTAQYATNDAAGVAFATGYVHTVSDETVGGQKTFSVVTKASAGTSSGNSFAVSAANDQKAANVVNIAAAAYTISATAAAADVYAEEYLLIKNSVATTITWSGVTWVDDMDTRKNFGSAADKEMLVKLMYIGGSVYAEVLHNTDPTAYGEKSLGDLAVEDFVIGRTV